MDHAGLASLDDVGSVRLAGAFGSHIDPLYALVLGLLPDCPPDRVRSVGNAAGSGAVRALLSARGPRRDRRRRPHGDQDRDRDRARASRSTSSPRWRSPTPTDPYPNLSQVVHLPERRVAADAGTSRRRRGRTRRPTTRRGRMSERASEWPERPRAER